MTGDLISPLWRAQEPPSLDGPGWERLLSQARRARLMARLGVLMADRGWSDRIPAGPSTHMDNALRQVQRLRDQTLWDLDRIAAALADLPGPVVILKGAAYVAAGLPPARGRYFTDVDVMVPAAQIRAAERNLFAAGWIAAQLDPYDERYYRDLMHEIPPMEHVERRTSLDLHHAITPPTSRFAVDSARLFQRVQPLPGLPGLFVLHPADMVLHGVVHLLQDGEFSGGQRDLLDFHELLVHFGADPAFWPGLVQKARELGLQRSLGQALAQARRLFDTPVPAALQAEVAALQPPGLRSALMQHLLTAALRPSHPDCDSPVTGLARWLLYVRSHWLRMPWYQILPHLARKAWMRAAGRVPAQGDAPAAPGL